MYPLPLSHIYIYRWGECSPGEVFLGGVTKVVSERNKDIEKNLKKEAQDASLLVLWLDCDREGENIAFEVIDVCKAAKRSIKVKRARFSALIPR
jgi:DNA topoisomerase-3